MPRGIHGLPPMDVEGGAACTSPVSRFTMRVTAPFDKVISIALVEAVKPSAVADICWPCRSAAAANASTADARRRWTQRIERRGEIRSMVAIQRAVLIPRHGGVETGQEAQIGKQRLEVPDTR
ncbi:MAG: hypothetical protein ACOYMM_12410 [Phycisphaerales bacterium]